MQDWSRIVGEAIYNRRMDLSMTAKTLAKQAGVGIETIYQLESGIWGPRAHNLFKIAQALECSMDSLYSGVLELSTRTGVAQ